MELNYLKLKVQENLYFYLLTDIQETVSETEEAQDKVDTIKNILQDFDRRDELIKHIYARTLIEIADRNLTEDQIENILFEVTESFIY